MFQMSESLKCVTKQYIPQGKTVVNCLIIYYLIYM